MSVIRVEVLEFISNLSGPIGPEIFAGFGGKLRAEMAKDPFAGERAKAEWATCVNIDAALDCLFEIAGNPPGKTFYNNFYERFKDEWNFVLTELMFLVGKRNYPLLEKKMAEFGDNKNADELINQLILWREEEG